MTAFSDEVRDAVVSRAGGRCEYCHLPTRGQVATFPIDHVNATDLVLIRQLLATLGLFTEIHTPADSGDAP